MSCRVVQGGFVGQWVADKAGGHFDTSVSKAIGLKRNDKLIAGVIYEHWTGSSFVCHIAFMGRLTREFIAAVFQYPFLQCGASKLIAPIDSSNLKALGLVGNMGFVEEGRISGGYPDGDIVLLTLSKESCRFLDW